MRQDACLPGCLNSFIAVYLLRQHGTQGSEAAFPAACMATGEYRGAFSMSEPEPASDVASIRTWAGVTRMAPTPYNGQSMWLTNGANSTLVAVLVCTDENAERQHRNLTAFLVEKPTVSVEVMSVLTISGKIGELGYKGMDTTEPIFDSYLASIDDIRGGSPGWGFFQKMGSIEVGRVNVLTRACGVSIRAFELVVHCYYYLVASYLRQAGRRAPEHRVTARLNGDQSQSRAI